MRKLHITILAILLVFTFSANGQQYEFGVHGAGTGYMGDINRTNPFYLKNVGGGLFAKYNFNSTWGLQFSANHLFIYGIDSDFNNGQQQQRNLFFNNQITEVAVAGTFNFFRYSAGGGTRFNRYTPYITAGVAAMIHDPYVNYAGGRKLKLRELQLEIDKDGNPIKYSRFALAIPIGVGFKYNIKGPWSLGAEINYRTVLSDNIDNVSQYYPYEMTPIQLPASLPSIISDNPQNQFGEDDWKYLSDPSNNFDINSGRARGDGKRFDGYMTVGVTLTYTLISTKCSWWQ